MRSARQVGGTLSRYGRDARNRPLKDGDSYALRLKNPDAAVWMGERVFVVEVFDAIPPVTMRVGGRSDRVCVAWGS